MNLAHLIPENLTSLSIIGLSKNAGKTTVLNAVVEKARSRYPLGLVSTGVDGEKHDVWSHRPKPSIGIPEGALVATAGPYLDERPGDWELLAMTGITTTAGELYIARAKAVTHVKLMGVPSTFLLRQVLTLLSQCGAGLALVDGAYDRKAAASPSVTEGTLLVVGGSMDASLERIILKAEELIRAFSLPVTSHLKEARLAMEEKQVILIQGEEVERVPISSLFQMQAFKKWSHRQKVDCVITPGAVTDAMIRGLMEQGQFVSVVVSNATHVFASLEVMRQFIKRGGAIEVVSPIQLLGVAYNPSSPEGYSFPSLEMKEKLERVCRGMPVFDVMREVE